MYMHKIVFSVLSMVKMLSFLYIFIILTLFERLRIRNSVNKYLKLKLKCMHFHQNAMLIAKGELGVLYPAINT